MIKLNDWKQNKKGKLITEVMKTIQGRSGLTCEHYNRQYDDDMCDPCLARRLVNMFEKTLLEVVTDK